MVGEQPVVAVWLLDRYRLSDVMHGLSIVMLVATALPLLALLALQNHPSQVAALAAAFGVPPSYLLDQDKNPSVLDEEVLEALANKSAAAILRESASLSERDKEIVLGIVQQFGSQIDDAQR